MDSSSPTVRRGQPAPLLISLRASLSVDRVPMNTSRAGRSGSAGRTGDAGRSHNSSWPCWPRDSGLPSDSGWPRCTSRARSPDCPDWPGCSSKALHARGSCRRCGGPVDAIEGEDFARERSRSQSEGYALDLVDRDGELRPADVPGKGSVQRPCGAGLENRNQGNVRRQCDGVDSSPKGKVCAAEHRGRKRQHAI